MQTDRVISYGSRHLEPHEVHYPTQDLELVKVIFAHKLWLHYLYGVSYEIYTNHESLKYIFNQIEHNLRQRRWIEFVKDYHIETKYQPGKANVVADSLSRKNYDKLAYLTTQQELLIVLAEMKIKVLFQPLQVLLNALSMEPTIISQIKDPKNNDEELKDI